GGLVGTFGGMWLAHDFTKLFLRVYQYPELVFRVRPNVIANAVLVVRVAAKCDSNRGARGGGVGAGGRVWSDGDGGPVAAGGGDAARAAGPLSADDFGKHRVGAGCGHWCPGWASRMW